MENRIKNNRVHLRFSDEEYEIIIQKFKHSKMKNLQDFILKCVLDEAIFNVDISPLKEISYNISAIGNNINQIAKRCNETRNFNRFDVEEMKNEYDDLKIKCIKNISFLRKKFKNTKVKNSLIREKNEEKNGYN
ncbi:MAG: MobC family plasmid mobilization relaxosome protein [Parvimonas sp.]|uniref:plasmid mobilization protein n=1 Tax=Parvimonas sp. TaxID=1944660 RepID=UPI0025E81380|nr:plasmid mobilization relaxosome protein MobC [Parvimonas sp.]MCI5996853.1 MobC family plasmid mobilization relaxosome protein [Parvimonas sp.]